MRGPEGEDKPRFVAPSQPALFRGVDITFVWRPMVATLIIGIVDFPVAYGRFRRVIFGGCGDRGRCGSDCQSDFEMKVPARRRQPRVEEIELMELLAPGPCALDSGPVGRCSSRGWIRHVGFDEIGRGVYELTASGHALVRERRVTVASANVQSE
jgi:hypothetical protein